MFRLDKNAIPAQVFRTYDIRGNTLTELSAELIHDIGLGLGSEALSKGSHTVILGRDGRLSSPSLHQALTAGILATGCNIIDIGIVPTPLLYFATKKLPVNSGIMLTGSHNPRDDNGIKTIINGKSLTEAEIQDVLRRIREEDVCCGQGKVTEYAGIIEEYIKDVQKRIPLKKKLKIVIDAGNGATALVAPELYRALGCEVIPLFCTVDGSFPNHHPDPAKPKNLETLIATVKKEQADVGLAFDGDGDRLGIVTPQGKIIYPDRQLMLFAKSVLKKYPGGKIVFDVKCSKFLGDVIREAGGVPVLYKTGHSLIKAKMLEEKAELAGEMSGHIFFCDNWYGFDDGMYSGARALEILAADGRDLDAIFAEIPDSISTPELNIAIPDNEKHAYVKTLQEHAHFKDAKIICIDGLRVEFPQGWGLVRASNTTPMLTLRFEADTEENLKMIIDRIKAFMLQYKPDLQIDF